MLSTTIDASLAERIRRGEYEVDPQAVAQAMINRWAATSFMLIAAQAVDEPAVRPDEGEPGAGPDVA
jgi:Anti-sigma-28 factor, FlgM